MATSILLVSLVASAVSSEVHTTNSGDLAFVPGDGQSVLIQGPVVATHTLVLGDSQTDVGATLAKHEKYGIDLEALWTAVNTMNADMQVLKQENDQLRTEANDLAAWKEEVLSRTTTATTATSITTSTLTTTTLTTSAVTTTTPKPPTGPSGQPNCIFVGTEVWCFTDFTDAHPFSGYNLCGYASAREGGTYYPASQKVRDALSKAGLPAMKFGCGSRTKDSTALGESLTFTSLQGGWHNHIQCRANGNVDMYGGSCNNNEVSCWSEYGPNVFVRCTNLE